MALPQPADKVAPPYLVLFLLLSDTFFIIDVTQGAHSLTDTLVPTQAEGAALATEPLGISSVQAPPWYCVLRAGISSQKAVWVPAGRYFQRHPDALK